ncbi:uncharacterized protein BDZ83DRAFT_729827 [Colletotrichum acutatum]|uniref:Uncharacterized protein n=1 Tax=Glomerella acutata TaxID=27357 RepID=A0AAD8UQV5_GLOAC|nr:uncharacterized protein BDZ83DRAFT_729827 [Colletotrichum acutatum]KAK1726068.1 hypothetical protein BDZ83DRAFT_729827 [Colletotrichum acutatum]
MEKPCTKRCGEFSEGWASGRAISRRSHIMPAWLKHQYQLMTVRAMAQNRQPSGGYKQEPDHMSFLGFPWLPEDGNAVASLTRSGLQKVSPGGWLNIGDLGKAPRDTFVVLPSTVESSLAVDRGLTRTCRLLPFGGHPLRATAIATFLLLLAFAFTFSVRINMFFTSFVIFPPALDGGGDKARFDGAGTKPKGGWFVGNEGHHAGQNGGQRLPGPA